MVTRLLLCAVFAATTAFFAAGSVFGQPVTPSRHYVAPGEFEPQVYIRLSWVEQGWLGGAPFSGVTLDVMRAITPHVRVRLMFSAFTSEDASMFREPFVPSPAAAEDILRKRLKSEGIDLSRVALFYYPHPAGHCCSSNQSSWHAIRTNRGMRSSANTGGYTVRRTSSGSSGDPPMRNGASSGMAGGE